MKTMTSRAAESSCLSNAQFQIGDAGVEAPRLMYGHKRLDDAVNVVAPHSNAQRLSLLGIAFWRIREVDALRPAPTASWQA